MEFYRLATEITEYTEKEKKLFFTLCSLCTLWLN